MKKIPPMNRRLRDEISIPGDKSISHRAIMLAGLGNTAVEIENFLNGADCLSTINCMKSFGITKIASCLETLEVY